MEKTERNLRVAYNTIHRERNKIAKELRRVSETKECQRNHVDVHIKVLNLPPKEGSTCSLAGQATLTMHSEGMVMFNVIIPIFRKNEDEELFLPSALNQQVLDEDGNRRNNCPNCQEEINLTPPALELSLALREKIVLCFLQKQAFEQEPEEVETKSEVKPMTQDYHLV